MNITIRNNASVPGKYERKIKWLIYNLAEKFKDILYARVFFNKEGSKNPEYQMSLVLGMSGKDVIIKAHGPELSKLIMDAYNSAKVNVQRKLGYRR